MKKFSVLFLVASILLGQSAIAARNGDFVDEAATGLDHISMKSRAPAPEGALGQAVYPGKVTEPEEAYIPTVFYTRLGLNAGIGFASTPMKMDGKNEQFQTAFGPEFGLGWNMFSSVRSELAWSHSDSDFAGTNMGLDMLKATLYLDAMSRNILMGDVMYRRQVVPFLGVGLSAGYADFEDSETQPGRDSYLLGAHVNVGVSFVLSDTRAIDLIAGYQFLGASDPIGWENDSKEFGNFNFSLSWRAGF